MKRQDEAVRHDWMEADVPNGFETQPVPEETGRSAAFDIEFAVVGGKRRRPLAPIRIRGRRR